MFKWNISSFCNTFFHYYLINENHKIFKNFNLPSSIVFFPCYWIFKVKMISLRISNLDKWLELLKHGVLVFVMLCVQYLNGLNNYAITSQLMKRTNRQMEKLAIWPASVIKLSDCHILSLPWMLEILDTRLIKPKSLLWSSKQKLCWGNYQKWTTQGKFKYIHICRYTKTLSCLQAYLSNWIFSLIKSSNY